MAARKNTGTKRIQKSIKDLKGELIVDIEVSRLKRFTDHPFQVKEDEDLKNLMESIKENGILNPLLVMPTEDGNYEIVSGHRRKACAEILGLEKVPVIIRYMTREESVITMVDSNLHRQKISYSEKAFAYKMKNEAIVYSDANVPTARQFCTDLPVKVYLFSDKVYLFSDKVYRYSSLLYRY